MSAGRYRVKRCQLVNCWCGNRDWRAWAEDSRGRITWSGTWPTWQDAMDAVRDQVWSSLLDQDVPSLTPTRRFHQQ